MTSAPLPDAPQYFVDRLAALERLVQDAVLADRRGTPFGLEAVQGGDAGEVVREAAAGSDYSGDTIYRLDEHGEAAVLDFCESWARQRDRPFILVAEGLAGDGRRVFPAGADPADATFECIVDPVDGTRGLMYDKRSAWVLAAVAPGQAILGRRPALRDLAVAVQTELPTSRARLVDTLWGIAGEGAAGETRDLCTGEVRPLRLRPSRATGLAHGFATIAKFFPGAKERAARLEERLFAEVVGDHAAGAPLVFDDEYISSGGQLYELMVGHDRFVADLRPPLMAVAEAAEAAEAAGGTGGAVVRRLCARPYDLCTALIAQEAGVVVTDEWGRPLAAPLDTAADVAWVGYANVTLRRLIEPALQRLLREMGAPETR